MARQTSKKHSAELLEQAMRRIQQARTDLIAKRYASLRGDAQGVKEHERKARRHLQAAKRLLERVDRED